MLTRLVLILAGFVAIVSPIPAAAKDQGRLLEYPALPAAGLPPQRLTIWLPPGYDRSKQHYGVVYMHDGHNLFDLRNSNFNKIWAADKAMLAAMQRARIRPYIIVGIWAPGKDRYRQYLPRPAYDAAPPALRDQMAAMAGGPVVSDTYLDWIAEVLKPWIDRNFRTFPGRDDTAIVGSSMGGLMSCYAFVARPQTFGRAACVSSHWPATDPAKLGTVNSGLADYWGQWLAGGLGVPDGRRLWLDHGTATLDAYYAPYQSVVDARLTATSWQRGRDWQSKVYPGAEHEENAWAARLPEIFGWLLRR